MWANSSSVAPGDSPPLPDLGCFTSPPTSFIFVAFCIVSIILLLSLSLLILLHGLLLCRSGSTSTSSSAAVSHIDSITYHMVAMELIPVAGNIAFLSVMDRHPDTGILVVLYCSNMMWCGETFFNLLTCVERYLAAVRPVTYLRLRGSGAVRMRELGAGCVWLLSLLGLVLSSVEMAVVVTNFGLMIPSLLVSSLCSAGVLHALTKPKPGEPRGTPTRPARSKLRAFHTIAAIMAVLLLKFSWGLVWCSLHAAPVRRHGCVIIALGPWINLPSSLLLPLLFLQRKRKSLLCFRGRARS